MAWRPDNREQEILTEEHLKELRDNLAHLSLPAVRDFYETAYGDCRLVYDHHAARAGSRLCPGVEALVEMSVIFLRRLIQMPRLTTSRRAA